MPTAGLTGEGLKKYQRWLAVQRAKGREPSQNEIQSFLQAEIQANINTDLARDRVSLEREGLDLRRGELENITRRTDLLERQQKNLEGAAKISGLGEIAKTVGTVNQLTGGAITEGLKWAGSSIWDYVDSLGDPTYDAVTEGAMWGAEMTAGAADYGLDQIYDYGSEAVSGVGDYLGDAFDFDIDEVWDISDIF